MAPIMEMKEDGSWDYILAESVDVNEDMTQYTVHLRSDAKWSNGDDVTSADFQKYHCPRTGSELQEWLFLNALPDCGS